MRPGTKLTTDAPIGSGVTQDLATYKATIAHRDETITDLRVTNGLLKARIAKLENDISVYEVALDWI